jgi:hypothetical protein
MDFTLPIFSPPAVTTGHPCNSSVAMESRAKIHEKRFAAILGGSCREPPLTLCDMLYFIL